MVTAQEWFDSGMMYVTQGKIADAAQAFQNAVMIKPEYHEAWSNRGNALHQLGNHFDAVLNYNQAIRIDDRKAEYFNNRGATWVDLGCHDSALADYHRTLVLNPKMATAHSNIGNLYKTKGWIEKARDAYAKAVELDPKSTDALLNKSVMELELGNLVTGFQEFEIRWKSGQIPPRGLPCPDWEGEDLNGKRLLLYSEQGLGDALQFVRYATVIKEKYPDSWISVECRLAVKKLMATVKGVDEVFQYGDDLPPHDFGCAMMSAPRVIGTTMETIPAWERYMSTDPHRVKMWRERMDHDLKEYRDRLKVGICWSGQARPMQPIANSVDKRRSTHLNQWSPLATVPGVIFVSLQQGAPSEQCRTPPANMTIADWNDQFDDFSDTCALMENLDLIISVDTSVVHAAAAIGRPVWMLSRYDGCWRWHGDRKDSPWYPTLTQYRQPTGGDWDSVMKEVASDLRRVSTGAALIAAE